MRRAVMERRRKGQGTKVKEGPEKSKRQQHATNVCIKIAGLAWQLRVLVVDADAKYCVVSLHSQLAPSVICARAVYSMQEKYKQAADSEK